MSQMLTSTCLYVLVILVVTPFPTKISAKYASGSVEFHFHCFDREEEDKSPVVVRMRLVGAFSGTAQNCMFQQSLHICIQTTGRCSSAETAELDRDGCKPV